MKASSQRIDWKKNPASFIFRRKHASQNIKAGRSTCLKLDSQDPWKAIKIFWLSWYVYNRFISFVTCCIVTEQAVINYIHSHRQVWVNKDMQLILDEPRIAALKDGPFVGIHVRRGDKIGLEADLYEVQVYLRTVWYYLACLVDGCLWQMLVWHPKFTSRYTVELYSTATTMCSFGLYRWRFEMKIVHVLHGSSKGALNNYI